MAPVATVAQSANHRKHNSSGHMGRFGHEFLGTMQVEPFPLVICANMLVEFDFRVVGDGRSAVARYANNSNYRNDSLIRKESTPPSSSSSCLFLTQG